MRIRSHLHPFRKTQIQATWLPHARSSRSVSTSLSRHVGRLHQRPINPPSSIFPKFQPSCSIVFSNTSVGQWAWREPDRVVYRNVEDLVKCIALLGDSRDNGVPVPEPAASAFPIAGRRWMVHEDVALT